MDSLYHKLISYSNSDYYGFHMPGTKRNAGITGADLPYQMDITEIEGFDDLHHADGIIRDIEKRASHIYRCDDTRLLVNGSTAGILSAILGCTKKGDRILVARNSHKSVYHAVCLNELTPVYVYPGYHEELELNGAIAVSDVQQALALNPDISAVVITSPTYDGVTSDVRGIADAAHARGIPLIVDEAHGAHFGFHPYFPDSANTQGADVVIHSLHKTLPALTQTALIHVNGNLADWENIGHYLQMLQTSSPSYVLMSSIDVCISMLEERKKEVFSQYVELLVQTRERLSGLEQLKLTVMDSDDRSKLVISVKDTDCTSRQLYQMLLNDYHLQMEMVAGSYVLGMTSVADTREGMNRLVTALFEIDGQLRKKAAAVSGQFELPVLNQVYSIAQAGNRKKAGAAVRYVEWKDSEGGIANEFAYLYPPGIPLIVPGEQVDRQAVAMIEEYVKRGFTISGLKKPGKIEVLING